jgi:phage baseplate assembly protein W
MAFNPQQIYPIDLNASKAVGVSIPFNGSAVFKSTYLTKDAIKNNLINFFLTNPGEIYLNPTFGGGLRAFIFEQITNGNIEGLKSDIQSQIALYFPTVIVASLDVLQNTDDNTITVVLKYNVKDTGITDQIQIAFQ